MCSYYISNSRIMNGIGLQCSSSSLEISFKEERFSQLKIIPSIKSLDYLIALTHNYLFVGLLYLEAACQVVNYFTFPSHVTICFPCIPFCPVTRRIDDRMASGCKVRFGWATPDGATVRLYKGRKQTIPVASQKFLVI